LGEPTLAGYGRQALRGRTHARFQDRRQKPCSIRWSHIYAADRIWLSRVLAEPRATFSDPEDRDLTLLQTEWPALHQRWKLWLRDFNDDDAKRVIEYHDMKGRPYSQPFVADSFASGESWDASSGTGFRLPADHGPDAAAAGLNRILSGDRLSLGGNEQTNMVC